MPQGVIHQYASQHRLGDGRRPDPHARIVAAGGLDRGRGAADVDGPARQADARGRLERDRHGDLLPRREAHQHTAVVVGDEALRRHLVAVLASLLPDGLEAGADLHAFDRIDRHHRARDIGVEPAIDRLAPAHRHALRDHVDARTARVAALAQLVHEVFQLLHDLAVRREERIRAHRVPRFKRNFYGTDLRQIAAHHDAISFLQPLLRDRARGDAHHGLARGGPAAAARVARAVFLPVRVVGVARAEFLRDRRVVLRALVLVAHEKADRGAGGPAFVHAREDLHGVGLAPLRDVARGPGLPFVQLCLYVVRGQGQARRAAVDHAAVRGPVRLAEPGDAIQRPERITRHEYYRT